MKFNLESNEQYTVISYRPGEITIFLGVVNNPENERREAQKQTLSSSFILAPDQLLDWPVSDMTSLKAEHLQPLLALEPEVLLLGTGRQHQFPDVALLTPVHAANIGYEVMDSQAACRTYNLLRGEGRRVVAGIIL